MFTRNFLPCFYDGEGFVILHITLLFFRQLLLSASRAIRNTWYVVHLSTESSCYIARAKVSSSALAQSAGRSWGCSRSVCHLAVTSLVKFGRVVEPRHAKKDGKAAGSQCDNAVKSYVVAVD